MVTARVTVNTVPLDKLKSRLGAVSKTESHPAWAAMRTQWGRRIEAFTRRRFDRFSKGGGDWPPLALRTVNARRRAGSTSPFAGKKITSRNGLDGVKTRGGRRLVAQAVARDTTRGGGIVGTTRRAAILVDTGTLKAAISIGVQGNLFRSIPGGVRYGIEGGMSRKSRKVSTTVAGKNGKLRRKSVAASLSGRATLGQIAKWHQTGAGRLPKREIVVRPDAETVKGMESDLSRACGTIIRDSGAGRRK